VGFVARSVTEFRPESAHPTVVGIEVARVQKDSYSAADSRADAGTLSLTHGACQSKDSHRLAEHSDANSSVRQILPWHEVKIAA
jgi:hypothetical protein